MKSLLGFLCLMAWATWANCGDPYHICYAPPPHDYGGYRPDESHYADGARIQFYCDDGYTLSRSSYADCVYDSYAKKGHWRYPDSEPICKRK